MKNFKDQMLMIMYIVTNEENGEFFSVADIQFLMTDILGLPEINQINGVFKNNKSWFKKEEDPDNKRVCKRKLLQGAKDYIHQLIECNNVS